MKLNLTTLPLLLALVLTVDTLSAEEGRTFFVDPAQGDDTNPGTEESPFQSLPRAIAELEAGDTVQLREGVYLGENIFRGLKGTPDAPITIQSYPGEHAVLDGGVPYFRAPGNSDWEPVEEGAPDEWRSTMEFPSGMTGQFLDTGIRLLRYSNANDFRAENQLTAYGARMREEDPRPGPEVTDAHGNPLRVRRPWVYYGPGIYWNPGTRRVHIRLSHTDVAPLIESFYDGENDPRRPEWDGPIPPQSIVEDYKGETDPRKLPLALSIGGNVVLDIENCEQLHFRDLTVQNGGAYTARLTGNRDLFFEDIIFRVEQYSVRFSNDVGARFLHCEFDGGMPPWSFRGDFKTVYNYRQPNGDVRRNNAVRFTSRALFGSSGATDLEVAYCEFRNAHDVYLGGVNTLFHHNLIEDIHDDGLFVSTGEIENMHIYRNLLRRCLMAMAFHGNQKGVSRFVYRNVFDLRTPTRGRRPVVDEPGANWAWRALFIAKMGQAGPFSAYQNTFLVRNGTTMMGGLRFHDPDEPRRIMNNIIISLNPDRPIAGRMDPAFPAERDGNIWFRPGSDDPAAIFAGFETLDDFRASEDFEKSRAHYPPGWEAGSMEVDPRFISFHGDARPDDDLRLREDSPARGAGVILPGHLEDPWRPEDGTRPDIGAFPFHAEPMRVGRHGRIQFPETD